MRFSAPIPSQPGPERQSEATEQKTLPAIRGQAFDAVTDAQGRLSEPLPLAPGTRVRVVVL